MDRPNSIHQKFSSINKCDICFNSYNRTNKQPVIICSMHHTICRQCMVGLQNKPNCPFCRQKIKFDKVVVNNYINQLLPHQPTKPNTRVEVQEKSPPAAYPAQANRFVSNQSVRSLNFNQVNQIYPTGSTGPTINRQFSVPNLNGEIVHNNLPPLAPPLPPLPQPTSFNNRPLERVYQQEFHPQHEWDSNAQFSSELNRYICLYIIQIPFTFFNLYFALASPRSECMDRPRRLTILVVRPWLMSMGIIQLSLMVLFLLVLFLYYKRCIQNQTFQKLRIILGVLLLIKILVWLFAQLQLFEANIAKYCSGGIYAYGVVMTVLHGLLMLLLCVFANFRRN